MHVMIAEQIELAKRGEHPRLICCLGSSWLFMGRYQFLPVTVCWQLTPSSKVSTRYPTWTVDPFYTTWAQ